MLCYIGFEEPFYRDIHEHNQQMSTNSSRHNGHFEAIADNAPRDAPIAGESCEEGEHFTPPPCEKNGVLPPSLKKKLLVRLGKLAPKIERLQQVVDR